MAELGELVKPTVRNQPVYIPGRPIEMVAREIGYHPHDVLKLASNENPLGSSPLALEAARRAIDDAWLYPENDGYFLKERLAERHQLDPENFVVGAGSVQVVELLGHLFVEPGVEVVMGESAFIAYKLVTLLFGGTPVEVPLKNFVHDLDGMREAITDRTRLVFLPSPSNPTGTENDPEAVVAFARSLPDQVTFVFDEAYAEFLTDPEGLDLRPLIAEGRRVVCLRTFSKIFGLAGLRIGYGYGNPEVIAYLNRVRQPFNVNAVAQAAAIAALEDDSFVERTREVNAEGLKQLACGLQEMGLPYTPSRANFLMVELPGESGPVVSALQERGVIVRPLQPYGLSRQVRISVGTEQQNAKLLASLPGCL